MGKTGREREEAREVREGMKEGDKEEELGWGIDRIKESEEGGSGAGGRGWGGQPMGYRVNY